MDTDNNIRISEIISKKIIGDLSEEENMILARWLSFSEKNRELYARLTNGPAGFTRDRGSYDTGRALKEINAKIRRRTVRRLSLRIASVSAAIALVMVALFRLTGEGEDSRTQFSSEATLVLPDGSRVGLSKSGDETEWMEHVVDAGQQIESPHAGDNIIKIEVGRGRRYKFRLPDGSAVWLNSDSGIEYPAKFEGGTRGIALSGEAYFEVVKDSLRPFVVTTRGGVDIRVLGTKFNVDGHDDSEQMRVSLIEGSVAVGRGNDIVVLRPNQQAVFDHSTGMLTVRELTDAAMYASWVNGNLDYVEEQLEAIFGSLEKRFDIEFVYKGVEIPQLGHFTIHTGEAVLDEICGILEMITGLDYEIDGRYVYVTRR